MEYRFVFIILILFLTRTVFTQTPIQLIGGSKPNEGTVIVHHDGEWGSVCDDGFDATDAGVLCRMLGFEGAETYFTSAHFGQARVPRIWLYNLGCTGSETDVSECPNARWTTSGCYHNEDVGLQCIDGPGRYGIGLVGGNTHNEGTVAVWHDGEWGSICDDGFTHREATVVCHMLGYQGAGQAYHSAHFGQLDGPIWLDNLYCSNYRYTNISQCSGVSWGSHDCRHGEDVGVRCNTDIYLTGGSGPNEGTIHIKHDGQWGTICDNNFDTNDAKVVCAMLGYEGSAIPHINSYYGAGNGSVLLDHLACSGTERNVSDCTHSGWSNNSCSHSDDAGVTCPSRLHLSGGSGAHEGTINMTYNGESAGICTSYFHQEEAEVICRMLGYFGKTPVAHRSSSMFGRISNYVHVGRMDCAGTERSIYECVTLDLYESRHSCDNAGVECGPYRLYLHGGNGIHEGTINVEINGTLGSICGSYFSQNDAEVVCRMLGYDGVTSRYTSSGTFGYAAGPTVLRNLQCTGKEDNITQCQGFYSTPSSCGQTNVAAVICRQKPRKCYRCEDISDPKYCNIIDTCKEYEVCFLEEHLTGDRNVYRSGCLDIHECQKHLINDGDKCQECCQGDFCNHKGCGMAGLPAREDRGPVCYDCHLVSNPSQCNTLKLCRKHEVCAIEQFEYGDSYVYNLGCSDVSCSSLEDEVPGPEKRSIPFCRNCCLDDHCNTSCDNNHDGELVNIFG